MNIPAANLVLILSTSILFLLKNYNAYCVCRPLPIKLFVLANALEKDTVSSDKNTEKKILREDLRSKFEGLLQSASSNSNAENSMLREDLRSKFEELLQSQIP